MKNLLKKTWFQIVVAGGLIGLILIVVDNKYHIWNGKKDEGQYHGPVDADKDEMYVTTADYSEIAFDFGKIKETDTVSHKFIVKNTGKEPLFIFKAVGSCECVRPDFSQEPVAPEAETVITVYFVGKGRKGKQNRSVMVTTNTDPAEMVLKITGEVE